MSEWRMASGEWRVASGELRMANGEWRVANGEWRMASGEWRVANSKMQFINAQHLNRHYNARKPQSSLRGGSKNRRGNPETDLSKRIDCHVAQLLAMTEWKTETRTQSKMLDIVVTLIGLWRLFEELFRKTSFFHSMTSITVMTYLAFFARHDTSSIYIIYVQVLIVLLICLATYRNGKINALFSSTYLLLLFALVGTNYVSLTSTQVGNISSPLKHGDFYIVQGGNNSLLNAHRFSNAPAQRYALDLSKVSGFGRRTVSFFGMNSLSDYLIFNEPVFAPCDGVVTQTNDQFENMPIGDQDEQNPAGNFVAIACVENFTVVLAHLQRSLDVVAGQSVVSGERIGFVGNSGNSTEPHLHVHAVSGKPARIEDVLFTGEGIKLTVEGKTLIKNSMLSMK